MEKIYTNHEIDTIYADTANIEFFNDSIFITHGGGLFNFPIDKSSKYRLSYPGYTFFDYVLSEDTLFATHSWVIDRGGDRPGTAITNSVLIKEN